MNLFRRSALRPSWSHARITPEAQIATLRAMLEARDADVARLQRENDELVKANMFVVTRLNKALHEKAMAGRTARGTFVGKIA